MDLGILLDADYWRRYMISKWRQTVSFNTKAQIVLLEDLISQIDAGVPTINAFTLFSANYQGDTKKVCLSVIRALNEGGLMVDGFKGWFPEQIIISIRVGEQRGLLVKTLRNVIDYLQANSGGVTLFLSKSAYSLMIMIMAFVMAVNVNDGFYAVVKEIKPMEEWPSDAATIYAFWQFMIQNWWLLLLSLCAVGALISYQLANSVGNIRSLMDDLPIYKQYRLQQGAVFLKNLGLLLQNGTSLNESLTEIEKGSTPYMKYHLRRMRHKLATGDGNEGDVLNTGLLQTETINRLRTLADVSDFEVAMVRLGEQTLTMTIKQLEAASDIFKYLTIALSGALIASVFAGSMSLAQSLG